MLLKSPGKALASGMAFVVYMMSPEPILLPSLNSDLLSTVC